MVLTHLLLVLTLATVAIVSGQERVCTYTDQEDTLPTEVVDVVTSANTLDECKSKCDNDTQCVALGFEAQGGTGRFCYLYYSVPDTTPVRVSTFSTQNTCSGEGQERVCTYTDQGDTRSSNFRDVSTTANTLDECKGDCDGDTQCVALVYVAKGGSGVDCELFYSLPSTEPAYIDTFSTKTCRVVDPCDESPCQNGGTCIGDAENGAFTCLCPFGFAGDTCQEECDFTCPPIKSCRHGKFQLEITGDGTCPSFTCVEKDKPGNGFGRFKGLRRFIRHRWLHG